MQTLRVEMKAIVTQRNEVILLGFVRKKTNSKPLRQSCNYQLGFIVLNGIG